jgi:hypothetical protein
MRYTLFLRRVPKIAFQRRMEFDGLEFLLFLPIRYLLLISINNSKHQIMKSICMIISMILDISTNVLKNSNIILSGYEIGIANSYLQLLTEERS